MQQRLVSLTNNVENLCSFYNKQMKGVSIKNLEKKMEALLLLEFECEKSNISFNYVKTVLKLN
ncbi:hypothetical protein CMU94_01885 [Elizabethkingia anophelis]|nr:hypothetical protein [Elizabethkingia anophelis]